jgi:hypothetical protein
MDDTCSESNQKVMLAEQKWKEDAREGGRRMD